MLVIRVFVAFRKSKVDNVDVVLRALGPANEEVVRFDVAVNYALFMYFLNALDLNFKV